MLFRSQYDDYRTGKEHGNEKRSECTYEKQDYWCLFPTDVRYSGFALSFNLANAIFGGSASYISFALINVTGDPIAPAYYMVFIAVLALGAMIASHEHTGKDLSEV